MPQVRCDKMYCIVDKSIYHLSLMHMLQTF